MNILEEKITDEVVAFEGRKLLHFADDEPQNSEKKKFSTPRKALRFTRRATVGVVRQTVKTTLRYKKTVNPCNVPEKTTKTVRHKLSPTTYMKQVNGNHFSKKPNSSYRTEQDTVSSGNSGNVKLHFEGKETGTGQDSGQRATNTNDASNRDNARPPHVESDKPSKVYSNSVPSKVKQTTDDSPSGTSAVQSHNTDSTSHFKLIFTEAEKMADGLPLKGAKVAAGTNERVRHSKLMFTEAEKAADASPLRDGIQEEKHSDLSANKKRLKPKSKDAFIKSIIAAKNSTYHNVSDEISKQADASENDAVRGADRERKVVSKGLHYGGRVGKWHRSGQDARLDKRQAKNTAKEIKLEQKSKQHFERYGDELPSKFRKDCKRQKRQMKRKQIRTFVDAKLGKGKVDVTLKVMQLIVKGTKKLSVLLFRG